MKNQQKTTSIDVPESSIEENDEEKSGNQSRHIVKKPEDEEHHKQHHSNSTISSSSSSSGSSKYFESSSLQKNLSKKSTEIVAVDQMYSTSLMTNDACSNSKTSSMNILHSNINDDMMRKKQKEKENLPTEQENWLRKNEKNDQQMCTIITKDEKKRQRNQTITFYESDHRP